MSSFNVNQNHPLIPREQTFVLDRKIISFHSEDRDIGKWPSASHFAVELPGDLRNVQSMRLVEISLPSTQHVFSYANQNTKLSFSMRSWSQSSPPPSPSIQNVADPSSCWVAQCGPCLEVLTRCPSILQPTEPSHFFTIEIDEGSYSPTQLATEIESKMNTAIQGLSNKGTWRCKYNDVSNTFWFGYEQGAGQPQYTFQLEFARQEKYPDKTGIPCEPVVWYNYDRWGLPAYLGYKKQIYQPWSLSQLAGKYPEASRVLQLTSSQFGFDYEYPEYWLSSQKYGLVVYVPDPSIYMVAEDGSKVDASGVPYGERKICGLNVLGDDAIYMELDRYNTLDEIHPYAESAVNTCTKRPADMPIATSRGGRRPCPSGPADRANRRARNARAPPCAVRPGGGCGGQPSCAPSSVCLHQYQSGRVNAAFAKIPVRCPPYSQFYDTRNAYLTNISHYQPPIERITKLRFKFRYHDGRPVNFHCLPFNFSIEFNMLKDEQQRAMLIRVPPLYNL